MKFLFCQHPRYFRVEVVVTFEVIEIFALFFIKSFYLWFNLDLLFNNWIYISMAKLIITFDKCILYCFSKPCFVKRQYNFRHFFFVLLYFNGLRLVLDEPFNGFIMWCSSREPSDILNELVTKINRVWIKQSLSTHYSFRQFLIVFDFNRLESFLLLWGF